MPLHSLQRLSPTAALGLWQLTESPAALWPALPAAYRALLPPTADATRQAQWLAGRALVHALLAALPAPPPAGLLVNNDAAGRPWLAGPARDLRVSLSHSGAWVAAVLARGGRVGVDVERIRDKAQRLASRYLAPEEQAAAQALIRAAPAAADAHYTLLWSAKETLYKLAGQRGILFNQQLLLDPIGLEETGEMPATLVLHGRQTRHCICYSRPAPGHVLTYCHEPAA